MEWYLWVLVSYLAMILIVYMYLRYITKDYLKIKDTIKKHELVIFVQPFGIIVLIIVIVQSKLKYRKLKGE